MENKKTVKNIKNINLKATKLVSIPKPDDITITNNVIFLINKDFLLFVITKLYYFVVKYC
jgi:hypothetical protein